MKIMDKIIGKRIKAELRSEFNLKQKENDKNAI